MKVIVRHVIKEEKKSHDLEKYFMQILITSSVTDSKVSKR